MINELEWYLKRAIWKESFSFLPRRCAISGQKLWGNHVQGTVIITGTGEPVVHRLWIHRHEHLLRKIKGE